MLQIAVQKNIMDFKLDDNQFTFQSIEHQFQCLVSTTDTYYRQLTSSSNQEFGILVDNEKVLEKIEISEENVAMQLSEQLMKLENLFKSYDDSDFEKNIKSIQAICNHEYLHQGQLLILLRQAGADVPERFSKAFAL